MDIKISDSERSALAIATYEPLVSAIPAKASVDTITGEIVPGIRVYNGLVAKGLLFFTEEPLIDEDRPELGTYTPVVVLTDRGQQSLLFER